MTKKDNTIKNLVERVKEIIFVNGAIKLEFGMSDERVTVDDVLYGRNMLLTRYTKEGYNFAEKVITALKEAFKVVRVWFENGTRYVCIYG